MTPFIVFSDLHLDGRLYPYLQDDLKKLANFEGYILLPGDVVDFTNKELYGDFLEVVFKAIPNLKALVAVLGNHEYYGANFEEAEEFYNWLGNYFPKFVLLNNQSNVWADDSYLFVGDTLWYPETPDVYLRTSTLNDFSEIDEIKFQEIFARNKQFKETVEQIGKPKGVKLIWLTHHLPSLKSVSAYYKGDPLNCYFVDASFETYIWRHQPDLLVHGHSHHQQYYSLGDSYVISNPRGTSSNPRFSLDRFLIFL